MFIDLAVVLLYFVVVMAIALSGKGGEDVSSEEFFLSGRTLKWHSIAISTIATNVSGMHMLGMMGSAYLYGLAQANFEINAIQGLWLAAFVFVPMYLRTKVVTITQFIEMKLGTAIARTYSLANILLYSTLGLGLALFWGAYVADAAFEEYLLFISDVREIRIFVVLVVLGIFSAIYTHFGGLTAVVRTDIMQFVILVAGGLFLMFTAIYHLGGWSQLYEKTPELMHLHLPSDHPKLPWTAVFGLFWLNINYWCANQTIIQRSLAARSLRDAQLGLMVGGILKYVMAAIIIIPGIALAGITMDNKLVDPDNAFPYMVTEFLPVGVRGFVLCAVFASMMSTVDSMFNSISTLWSVDIVKGWLKPNINDKDLVRVARKTIIFTLITGIIFGGILILEKFSNEGQAFTHRINELRYYVNIGIVVLICSAGFLVVKRKALVLFAFFLTVPLNLGIQMLLPDLSYLVRAGIVITIAFAISAIGNSFSVRRPDGESILVYASNEMKLWGYGLLISLVLSHMVFS